MKAKLGIAPIAWWNDDLAELTMTSASRNVWPGQRRRLHRHGDRPPLSDGRGRLGPILAAHGISVCGGWFSGQLLDGDIEAEKDRIAGQMAFFKAAAAPCIVYGETARSIQGDRSQPLATKPKLSEDGDRGLRPQDDRVRRMVRR